MTDLARAILDAILDQADMDGGIIRSHAEERVRDVLDTQTTPVVASVPVDVWLSVDKFRYAKHKAATGKAHP